MEDYRHQLVDPQAASLRRSTCSSLADAPRQQVRFFRLSVPQHNRAARSLWRCKWVVSLRELLRDNNRYGAVALVRQLVEIEPLLCLFALDSEEPERRALSDLATDKKEYTRMRERCDGLFPSCARWP